MPERHRRGKAAAGPARCGSAGWSSRARSSPRRRGDDRLRGRRRQGARPGALRGIVPDLFVEGTGVVAEGRCSPTARSSPTTCSPSTTRTTCRAARGRPQQKAATLTMIAEAGLAALWLAAALAALQLAGARRRRRGRATALAAGPRRRGGAGRCSAPLAFGALLLLFVRTDLSVALVAANIHIRQAADLQARRGVGQSRRLDAAVGHGDGAGRRARRACSSGGWPSGRCSRRSPRRRRWRSASTPSCCSPRTRSSGSTRRRSEGMGLNPLLQDLGLAFHPPTLYLGYVGLSVAFSFAVGALLTRRSARRSPEPCGRGCSARGYS